MDWGQARVQLRVAPASKLHCIKVKFDVLPDLSLIYIYQSERFSKLSALLTFKISGIKSHSVLSYVYFQVVIFSDGQV